jgi:hypothetical protein
MTANLVPALAGPGQASAAAISCHGLPARRLIAGLGGRAR